MQTICEISFTYPGEIRPDASTQRMVRELEAFLTGALAESKPGKERVCWPLRYNGSGPTDKSVTASEK